LSKRKRNVPRRVWRKRTSGSPRQLGQPFMLSSSQQKLKSQLPTIAPKHKVQKTEYTISVKDSSGQELKTVKVNAYSPKQAIFFARRMVEHSRSGEKDVTYEIIAKTFGAALRAVRAPKTAEATEEGLTRTKGLAERLREDVSRIEQRLTPPKAPLTKKVTREPPPLPP
jgi:hypothetical protein